MKRKHLKHVAGALTGASILYGTTGAEMLVVMSLMGFVVGTIAFVVTGVERE